MEAALTPIDWSIVGLYLLGMIGLGALLSSRIKHFKDYFLAGGMLTTPLLVCTLVSTYYELDVTLATSESGFHYGMVAWVWLSRPYYVAIILAALLLTARIKRYQYMTLPDILEHHYGRSTRIVGAIACFVYSLPITALAGMAVTFEVLGWPRDLGLMIAVGVCAVYTVMGGLWADAISDTIQFLLMCVSVAIAIPFALQWVGGWSFVDSLPELHLTATGGLPKALIIAWTVGALTVFVEPAFYQRIFAAKDVASVRRALLIGVALWASYDWAVTLIGMIACAAVEKGLLNDDLEGRTALLHVTMIALPIGLKGLFIGGILAAAMSSVDSYSLLASGNIVYDIIRPLRKQPLSDQALIRLTRAGVFIVMLIGVAVSLQFQRITDAWVFMSSVLASAVFVPVMGGLFLRPKPLAGLIACIAGLTGIGAYYVLVYSFGEHDEESESMLWRLGSFDLYREYAVLFALPLSLFGYAIGNLFGHRSASR